jgi:exopolysaccharide biosynthesis polyprenyl glycosylphosphotransferase
MTPQLIELTHEDRAAIALVEPPLVAVRAHPTARVEAPRRVVTAPRRAVLSRRLLVAADALAATVTFALVLTIAGQTHALAAFAVGVALMLVLLRAAGLYDRDEARLVRSTLDEVPVLARTTGLAVLGLAIAEPMVLDGGFAGAELGALWLASFAALFGCRVAARSTATRMVGEERCLVIGTLSAAELIRAKLASSDAHARIVATLPTTGGHLGGPLAADDLRHLVAEIGADRVILAPRADEDAVVVDLVRAAKSVGVPVSVVPRVLAATGSRAVELEDVDGLPMVALRTFALPRRAHRLKRAFDVSATALLLVVLSPLLAAIAAAIRLDSRGPVLFRQTRVGRDGRHFKIIKFRSMVDDADGLKDELRDLNEVGDGMFKISADPRITAVGRLLRRTSLDELPQLFNVLLGDMSLVGPRPLVVEEDDMITGLDRGRLHLTPGMTGPWQVLGARVPMQEMIGIDYMYVSSWSLWQDVQILLRTVRHVLVGGNV